MVYSIETRMPKKLRDQAKLGPSQLRPPVRRLASKIKSISSGADEIRYGDRFQRDESQERYKSVIKKKSPYEVIEGLFRILIDDCIAAPTDSKTEELSESTILLNRMASTIRRTLVQLSKNNPKLVWLAAEHASELCFYLQYRMNRQILSVFAQHYSMFPVLIPKSRQLQGSSIRYIKDIRLASKVKWIKDAKTRRVRFDAQKIAMQIYVELAAAGIDIFNINQYNWPSYWDIVREELLPKLFPDEFRAGIASAHKFDYSRAHISPSQKTLWSDLRALERAFQSLATVEDPVSSRALNGAERESMRTIVRAHVSAYQPQMGSPRPLKMPRQNGRKEVELNKKRGRRTRSTRPSGHLKR